MSRNGTPDINAGQWYLQAVGEREWDVCEPTTGAVVAQVRASGDAAAAAAGADAVACGLYACSPKEAGFEAEFSFLSFIPGRI